MVSSSAATVEQYLEELPDDRRADVVAVREVVNANMPDGVLEEMRYGMIAWVVDPEVSGPTDKGQPVMVAALAAQKQKTSLYMTAISTDPQVSAEFEQAWKAEVGSIDRGKSCVRFRTAAQAATGAIAAVLQGLDVDELVARADAPG